MLYILLELHGGAACASIVTDPDGNNLVLDSPEEAEEAVSGCQLGLIVEIKD